PSSTAGYGSGTPPTRRSAGGRLQSRLQPTTATLYTLTPTRTQPLPRPPSYQSPPRHGQPTSYTPSLGVTTPTMLTAPMPSRSTSLRPRSCAGSRRGRRTRMAVAPNPVSYRRYAALGI